MVRDMKRMIAITLLSCSCIKGGAEDPTPFTVWSGWNHTWEMLAHRVSLLRVKSNSDGTAESGILGGDWSTGDTWSDSVGYRIHQQIVSSRTIRARYGETSLSIGPDGSATDLTLLDDFDADLVLLSGFEITTDVDQPDSYPSEYDPALGYTSRGFGMSASVTADNEIHVEGTARWGPRDREDMNAAMAHAESRMTIWWTALSGVDAIEEIHIIQSQALAHDPPNSAQSPIEETLSWADTGPGIAGISALDLNLYDTDGGDGGDYLRSFGVEMTPRSDGTAPRSVSGEILTSNAIELGTMSMDLETKLIWIPTSATTIEAVTHEGNHEIGTHEIGPSQ